MKTGGDTAYQQVFRAIESWEADHGPLGWSDARFDALAWTVFAHQFVRVEPYRRLCQSRGVTPDTFGGHRQLPAVPTDAFKRLWLSAAPPGQEVRTFRTSGTTHGERGAHPFATLDLYRASLHPPFARFCLPPGRRQGAPLAMICLVAEPSAQPDSSLSFMAGELVERWGERGGSGFFFDPQRGVAVEAVARALDRACERGRPVFVLGTAFSFVALFDALPDARRWSLPTGSAAMETGGIKGRSRVLSRGELYGLIASRLGLEAEAQIHGEYSMTELSSQAYSVGPEGRFFAPPWARILVVDPVTLEPLEEPGSVGLIRWIDLANVDSVAAIQTSDRGRIGEDGSLELLGRAADAELRGCSLTVEEILEGQAPHSPQGGEPG